MKIKLNIVKKLTGSFLLIITIFMSVIIYSANFLGETASQYEYLIDFVIGRNRYLLEIQEPLRALNVRVRETFNNPNWLNRLPINYTAGSGESVLSQNDLMQLDSEIEVLMWLMHQGIDGYLYLLDKDIYLHELRENVNETAMRSMEELSNTLELTREYFHINRLEYTTDFSTLDGFTIPLVDLLEYLRGINIGLIEELLDNLQESHDYYMTFLYISLAVTVLITLLTFVLIILNFKNRIANLQQHAEIIRRGDFTVTIEADKDDEIGALSNVLGKTLKSFTSLIEEISNVSEQINLGDTTARIDENNFVGGYNEAAKAINSMAEEAIKVSGLLAKEEHYDQIQFILDKMPLAITFRDRNLKVVDCNQEIVRRYNIHNKEEYVSNFLEFYPAEYQKDDGSYESLLEKIQEAEEKGISKFDWIAFDSKGERIPLEVTMYKVDYFGRYGMISFEVDMRDHHKMLEEMKRSSIAEVKNQEKSRFLAKMSHEIRTPINAVVGISEIQLQNSELSLVVEEAFAKIHDSSKLLLNIVNDILDLSAIEEGKMTILNEEYESASLINDVLQIGVINLGSKQIHFDISIDKNIPKLLRGDELRLRQVLNNLISNAFKYTKEGTVFFEVNYITETDKPYLHFIIKDTGRGISKEDLKVLYSEFARFDQVENRNIQGSGLGLSIVHNFINLLNGNITVESELGTGTTFEVKIPQEACSEEVLGLEAAENLKTLKLYIRHNQKLMSFVPEPMPYGSVLVVDDVEANLYVAKGLLSFYNLNIETCDNGYEAVELVKSGKVYDIIFLDQMMPGIDGLETNKRLRKMGYEMPIVALTANALIGSADMFMENGFDGFISKPIDTTHLNAILNKFIRDKQPEEIIITSRENAKLKPNKNLDKDMWERFSGNVKTKKISQFDKNLRIEFARSQKNVISEIRAAFETSNRKDAQRFSHTLKGLARMLGEATIAETAQKLESLFEKENLGEETLENINLLEKQLNILLEAINAEKEDEKEEKQSSGNKLSESELLEILEQLEQELKSDSMKSVDLVEKLVDIPEASVLIRQVNDFDYEDALKTLVITKDILS